MRFANSVRSAALAGVLAGVLVACTATHETAGSGSAGSASGSPARVTITPTGSAGLGQSSGTKPVSAYCTKLRAAGARIQAAQVQLYTPGPGQATALNTLESELDALKVGAPASIQTAIADLASAFRQAQSLLTHPSGSTGTTLAQISSKLASDAQAITGYVASQC